MSKKSIILSSSGLTNLIQKSFYSNDCFQFIFGETKIEVNNIFAEFISPKVSHLHVTDPTITSLKIDNSFDIDITDDVIFLFKQISSGYSIEMSKEQSYKMKIISIYIDNKELCDKIDECFPIDLNNFEDHIEYFDFSSPINSTTIDNISSNFHSIDPNRLLRLPKSFLYQIISNDHLQIQNEDSLFDFINQLFSDETIQNDDGFNIASFYEIIEFENLSEEKFREFLDNFDFNNLTNNLWSKLLKCFYINKKSFEQLKNEKFSFFPFDGNQSQNFDGILYYLTNKSDTKVKLTSSSIYGPNFSPMNVIDFNNNENYFLTNGNGNEWIKFDFNGMKVEPTHYSIRSRPDGKYHPKDWVIEGSNTNNDNDWKIIDTRNNVLSFDGKLAVQSFKIKPNLIENECFRYLRMRLTGTTTSGHHHLSLTTFEFFGYLY